MFLQFKKFSISLLLNCFLLLGLILSIQNSNNKTKIDLLIVETIQLPISFIVGASFISGTFIGSLLPLYKK